STGPASAASSCGAGAASSPGAAEAAGVEAGAPALQSHVQVHVQEHAHDCSQSKLHVRPAGVVHVHVQTKRPVDAPAGAPAADAGGVAAPDGACAPAGAAACGRLVQSQLHTASAVGAASPAVAPGRGAHVPSQIQVHVHASPAGAPAAAPGRTTETFVLEPPLTVTVPSVALVPVAVAPFACVTRPSAPGLPTRTETFRFSAPVCVALA